MKKLLVAALFFGANCIQSAEVICKVETQCMSTHAKFLSNGNLISRAQGTGTGHVDGDLLSSVQVAAQNIIYRNASSHQKAKIFSRTVTDSGVATEKTELRNFTTGLHLARTIKFDEQGKKINAVAISVDGSGEHPISLKAFKLALQKLKKQD